VLVASVLLILLDSWKGLAHIASALGPEGNRQTSLWGQSVNIPTTSHRSNGPGFHGHYSNTKHWELLPWVNVIIMPIFSSISIGFSHIVSIKKRW